jgi:hypothetical protein
VPSSLSANQSLSPLKSGNPLTPRISATPSEASRVRSADLSRIYASFT